MTRLETRPFRSAEEYAQMVDYFLAGEDAFLGGMGIDLALLPTRSDWLAAAQLDAAKPDRQKDRFYVAWLVDGQIVGHSSISHIVHGKSAHCHLHVWRPELRGTGVATACLGRSVDLYFERFQLQSLASEPYAENLAPGRVLAKLGFRLIERYRTVPTTISFEQEVQRFEVSRDEWSRARTGAKPHA